MTIFGDITPKQGVIILTPEICAQIDKSIERGLQEAFRLGRLSRSDAEQKRATRDSQRLYTYKQVKKMFGLKSDTTIRNWAREEILEIVPVGSRRYVTAESIDRLNQKLMAQATL